MYRAYFCGKLDLVAKTKPRLSPVSAAQPGGPAQLNLKLPHHLLQAMDDLVDEINGSREWPKMTRSDLIRLVVGRAIKERPGWLLGSEET
jgi:hypothetical protein